MQFALTVCYSDPTCKNTKNIWSTIDFCASQPTPVPIFVVIFLNPDTGAKGVFLLPMIEDRIKQIAALVKGSVLVNVLDL